MNLRRHLTHDIVDSIRQRLDTPEAEMLDKDEHDRSQIERCLRMFIQYVECSADNEQEGPTDSQMLASILERITALANIVVPKDTFVANLQSLNTSVSALADKTTKQDALIEQLISLSKTLLTKGTTGDTEDFSDEQTILDQITGQVANLSLSSDSATSDVNSAISSINDAVNSAPAATSTGTSASASTTGAANTATPAGNDIVTQTPAPVDASGTASDNTGNAANVSTTAAANTGVAATPVVDNSGTPTSVPAVTPNQ